MGISIAEGAWLLGESLIAPKFVPLYNIFIFEVLMATLQIFFHMCMSGLNIAEYRLKPHGPAAICILGFCINNVLHRESNVPQTNFLFLAFCPRCLNSSAG